MSNPLALVVDDEIDICELLDITLSQMEIGVRTAGSVSGAKALLEQNRFDLCLTDMRLPDGNGIELVEYIQETHPSLPVAVITAHGSMDTAVTALKSGAFDCISKPVDLNVMRKLVNTALKLRSFPKMDRRSRNHLYGESAPMREIRSKIVKLARSQAPIYISGESGTGKELVARLIHDKSPRCDKPFVAVNCGAIPSELMESEFFGHKKGSFSGAVADKIGLFQAAEGGTLFLDEVADLPPPLQVKLLRAIQEKSIRPVGEQREIAVDVRILSATHENLAEMVKDGDFRQDLFYRINVIELHVPPLRERRGDVAGLADHILAKLFREEGRGGSPYTPALSEAALSALQEYSFPGNVRELENILERAVTLCDGCVIRPEDLNLPHATPVVRRPPEPMPVQVSLEDYMDEVERKAIVTALETARWNKTAAAKHLGITFRALRYRLKKLGLE